MFHRGDLVTHTTMPHWGVGRVQKIVQGNLLVQFSGAGVKLLHPQIARLEKVRDDELLFLVLREVKVFRGRPHRSTRLIPIVKRPQGGAPVGTGHT